MKIYTIRTDWAYSVPTAIFFILFFSFPLIYTYITYITAQSTSQWISDNFILIIFDLIFAFGIGYFLCIFIKPPKKFVGKLIGKEIDEKGRHIMYFEVEKIQAPTQIKCYTKEENNYVVNADYYLYIKELNRKVRAIEEYK